MEITVGWIEAGVALFLLVMSLATQLWIVSSWVAGVNARVNRLHERSDRLYPKLEEIVSSLHRVEKWISHQEGIEEGLRRAEEGK